MKPPWEKLSRAVDSTREVVHSDPSLVALADNMGAYLREAFDSFDVSMADEEAVYVATVTVALFSMMVAAQIEGLEYFHVSRLISAFSFGLVSHIPPEVYRR